MEPGTVFWGTGVVPSLGTVSSDLIEYFPAVLSHFPTHGYCSELTTDSVDHLQTSRAFYEHLFFPVLSPVNSGHFGLLRLSAPSLHSRTMPVPPKMFIPAPHSGNFL